ncbi:hypothetical protein EVAR_47571_1 [Eumeta japonica]|uniref:Uncharacterized protein n=1 Tax=Eumeta variegata TaxID=151549 RepID=A0A4C1WN64_EUMVA|nr:hypothetical protein EVAR_47571_1 [Eumeta japonica]
MENEAGPSRPKRPHQLVLGTEIEDLLLEEHDTDDDFIYESSSDDDDDDDDDDHSQPPTLQLPTHRRVSPVCEIESPSHQDFEETGPPSSSSDQLLSFYPCERKLFDGLSLNSRSRPAPPPPPGTEVATDFLRDRTPHQIAFRSRLASIRGVSSEFGEWLAAVASVQRVPEGFSLASPSACPSGNRGMSTKYYPGRRVDKTIAATVSISSTSYRIIQLQRCGVSADRSPLLGDDSDVKPRRPRPQPMASTHCSTAVLFHHAQDDDAKGACTTQPNWRASRLTAGRSPPLMPPKRESPRPIPPITAHFGPRVCPLPAHPTLRLVA